jgi:hypothetical protein
MADPQPAPDDLHEWLSFNDPDDDRTWVFDVTFLLSAWTCIFGHGCKGVLTEDSQELSEGCCSYGAHFIDEEDLAQVEKAAARLTDDQWQFRKRARQGFTKTDKAGTTTTRLADGACIFLNRPGFHRGAGCALHVGALDAGERFIDWKPDVCWQLPLRLQEHTDDYGHVTSTIREWKRRDWGDGGQEFHWWCTESPDAFVGRVPTYRYLRDELSEMIGGRIYDLLVTQLEARPKKTLLPHPAVRRG